MFMDFEQLVKKMEWLEEERRKDKLTISSLEDRFLKIEGNISPISQELKEMSNDLSRLQSLTARFDQIDAALSQIRVDYSRSIESIEKQRTEQVRDIEKTRLADLESLNSSISNVRKSQEIIQEMKKDLKAREDEEHRLVRLIAETSQKIDENRRADEEYRRNQKIMEESIRQDSKRLLDVQGEVSSIRKRVEEQRGKVDLANETLRKLEMRQNEFMNAEGERKQAQTAFIERQNKIQVERDRTWQEWQSRFEMIESQSTNLDSQLQSLDATQRAIKHAQEAFEEITQRFDRRINEITEMQRLVEDRFRQEWVSFKADDQKRWSNYMLSQDEQLRETNKQFEKIMDRLVKIEDLSQDSQDTINQILQSTQKRLQSSLNIYREFNNEFNDNFEVQG
jgi:chromosome segregation ATPase